MAGNLVLDTEVLQQLGAWQEIKRLRVGQSSQLLDGVMSRNEVGGATVLSR